MNEHTHIRSTKGNGRNCRALYLKRYSMRGTCRGGRGPCSGGIAAQRLG
jgi:hypothetical protein